jgi:hypothetical protein
MACHLTFGQNPAVPELVAALFDRHNLLVACDPRMGRYLTAATIFRGKLSSQEIEIAVQQMQDKNSSSFVDWIPDNVSITLCSVPPNGQTQAGICLSNTVGQADARNALTDPGHVMSTVDGYTRNVQARIRFV